MRTGFSFFFIKRLEDKEGTSRIASKTESGIGRLQFFHYNGDIAPAAR